MPLALNRRASTPYTNDPRDLRAALLEGQNRILRLIARGESLPLVLEQIARLGERLMEGALCSVLLVDDALVLRHGAAPSLPAAYCSAIDGVTAGPGVGSCGTAVFERRRVIVADIATHPYWQDYKELALSHGLSACWSDCILDRAGGALGSFAVYYRECREPQPGEFDVIDGLSDLAAIAIERHRADQRQSRLIQELAEQGQRLSAAICKAQDASRAKSDILTNMSHELRTPLNAIVGFSEVMANEVLGPLGSGRYKEYAGDIRRAGLYLHDLIGELLDMAKIEAGSRKLDLERIDAASEVDETVRMMHPRAAAGQVTLELNLTSAPPFAVADRRAFRQIVLNLVGNAVKFTPPGGSVSVRMGNAAGATRFEVRDTGCGIAADKIDQLGTPFFRIENPQSRTTEGTGLGLAISKSLIQLHGWSFRLESTLGRGTTVTVEIPDASAA